MDQVEDKDFVTQLHAHITRLGADLKSAVDQSFARLGDWSYCVYILTDSQDAQ